MAETLRGAAVEAGRREHGADAFRNFGRGFLLTVPAGLAAIGCMSGPVMALVAVGGIQRLVALRTAAGCLPRAAFADLPEWKRSWFAAIGTLAVAAPSVLFVSTGVVDHLPALAASAISVALPALWFGMVALELVCGALLAQRVDERFATGLERSARPIVAAFGAVGIELLADAAAPIGGAWSLLPRLGAIVAWGVAAGFVAWDASSTGEELVAEPAERELRAPSDAPASGGETPDPATVQAARIRRPEDDAPIPID